MWLAHASGYFPFLILKFEVALYALSCCIMQPTHGDVRICETTYE